MALREVEKGNIVPRKRGRPPGFGPEHNEQAFKLALLGATDEQMAEFWNVTQQTVDNWKRNAPGFLAALMRGKLEADANVAERLYQRAIGYSHEAVKIFMPAGAAEPVYAPYTEHYPPDTQAASLWLRNRQPAKWRDKQELDHTVKLSDIPDDELNGLIATLRKAAGGAGGAGG